MTDSVRPARKRTGKKAAESAFSFDDLEPQSARPARRGAAKASGLAKPERSARPSPAGKAKAATRAPGNHTIGPSKSDLIGVGVLVLVIVGAVALHWAINTFHPLEHRTHASLPLPPVYPFRRPA